MDTPDVFISYNINDLLVLDFYKEIKKKLKSYNFQVCSSTSIRFNENYHLSSIIHIIRSRLFLIFFNENWIQSHWNQFEFTIAKKWMKENRLPIVFPILLSSSCSPSLLNVDSYQKPKMIIHVGRKEPQAVAQELLYLLRTMYPEKLDARPTVIGDLFKRKPVTNVEYNFACQTLSVAAAAGELSATRQSRPARHEQEASLNKTYSIALSEEEFRKQVIPKIHSNYEPVMVDSCLVNQRVSFTSVWKSDSQSGTPWTLFVDLNSSQLTELKTFYEPLGYYVAHLDSVMNPQVGIRYTVLMKKLSHPTRVFHSLYGERYEVFLAQSKQEGFFPLCSSIAAFNSQEWYSGIMVPKERSVRYVFHEELTDNELVERTYHYFAQGLRLFFLKAYRNATNNVRFIAFYAAKGEGCMDFEVCLTTSELAAAHELYSNRGLQLQCLTNYGLLVGNECCYAASWTAHELRSI